jgi:hypothetical protein
VAVVSAAPAIAADGGGQARAAAPPMSVAITSVSPTIATPRATVTVSGTVTNATGTPAAGLAIQLFSSSVRLASRQAMDDYLTAPAGSAVDSPTRSLVTLASAVPAHATRSWSLTLRAKQIGMTAFGVYPLAVQLSQFGTPVDAARTFLPYWPGESAARRVKPVTLAWIWPLIDAPHQAACPALLNDSLAASLASGGRLNRLLAVGSSALARSADLTWAIDPALLNDTRVMTGRHRVGGTATCSGGSPRPASGAARSWLAGVQSVADRQDFFVTPYADVDAAALAHHGLNTELADAFADGRSEARAVLSQAQRLSAPANGRAQAGGTGMIAWPAGGIADYSVLESLAAAPNRIGTVILNSTMMQPKVGFTPTAVTTTPDGVYGKMHVLLADDGIEQILAASPDALPGTAPGVGGAGSSSAAAFAREQWFLAETAMIAAEAPRTARAVVVAPPRRWDPGAGLARALLAETVSAPWLHPASLSSFVDARQPGSQALRQGPPLHHVSQDELRTPLLRQVRQLDSQIALLASILVDPGPRYMSKAVAAVESSAWGSTPGGRRMARQLERSISAFVAAQQQQVTIVDPLRVTLGGKSGEVPVSISNHLGQAVRVQLQVGSGTGRVVIGNYPSPVTVAKGTQRTIKIPVRAAAAGSTTLTLWLTTPDGRPLPRSTAKLTVAATHFGTMAIVIIGITLAVFVLTAAGRAIRHGGGQADQDGDEGDDAQEADPTGPDPPYAAPGADTVERERAEEADAEREQAGIADAPKEPDGHASIPGWAPRR